MNRRYLCACSLPCRDYRGFVLRCTSADGMASFIPRKVPVMEVMAFLAKRKMTAGQVRLCPSEGKGKKVLVCSYPGVRM